ncbi:MAG: class I SAM-dependent methyltransferase [Candidatus Poribacteria bacterium]|nr:class I SAM-dependent methyltransferase [Candidatus Poribacteria bacterium]
MARQRKARTIYVATTGVAEYRATIPVYVRPDDVVLEVGCEWGTTTELIAEVGADVIGTDISPECIERARESRPNIRFEAIDAFDMPALLALNKKFTKIYLDLSGFSGYASLLDLISLLQMYAHVLEPEVIVAKSRSLKTFAHRCIAWEQPPKEEN